MRNTDDTQALELPGIKPPVVTKKRGRPAIHANPAARQRAFVARNGLEQLNVWLPEDLHAEFKAWLTSKGKKQSTVIAHLLRTQLLRKR